MTEAVVTRARTWPYLLIACASLVVWWLSGARDSALEYVRLLGYAAGAGDSLAGSYARGRLSGEIIGVTVTETAVVWAVLYFAVVRRRNPAAGLRHVLILGSLRLALEAVVFGYVLMIARAQMS